MELQRDTKADPLGLLKKKQKVLIKNSVESFLQHLSG
jgi:hypothetical protein